MNKKYTKIITIIIVVIVIIVAVFAANRNKFDNLTDPAITTENLMNTEQQATSGLDERLENLEETAEKDDKEVITNENLVETVPSTEAPTLGEDIDDSEIEDWNPEETQPDATYPTDPKPTETIPANPNPGELSYEQYNSMSSYEQQAYYESFGSVDAFLAWYDNALAEYEASKDIIDITGGNVNIGDLMG